MKKMDIKTRNMLTVHKAFHLKSDIVRLYLSRKKESERFNQLPGLYQSTGKQTRWYIKNVVEPLFKHIKKVGVINTKSCVTKEKLKQEMNKKGTSIEGKENTWSVCKRCEHQ